ncbi:MAG: hypothetical protein GEV10_20895 [Streptosporangiales bacterium]|nr:hypothetical protein [Streptosporangiales bacterium]
MTQPSPAGQPLVPPPSVRPSTPSHGLVRDVAGVGPFVGVALLLMVIGLVVLAVAGPTPLVGLGLHVGGWTQAALFAVGLALPLSARSPDLSLAGVAMFSGLAFSYGGGLSGLLLGLVVAAMFGVVNAALVGLLGLHPAITTLATGLVLTALGGMVASPSGRQVENPLPGAITVLLLVMVSLIAVAVDAMSIFGRVTSPLPDGLHRAAMHVAAALLAGMAGILQTSTMRFAAPAGSTSWLLLAGFAAVLIGGTSAFGGYRSLLGAVLAASFVMSMQRALTIANVTAIGVTVLLGALLLVALGADRLRAFLTRPRPAAAPR